MTRPSRSSRGARERPVPRLEGRLGRLLDATIEAMPHAVGAGLALMDHHGPRIVGSRRLARRIDELQLRLKCGILPSAAGTDRPASSTDLRTDPRWPLLGTSLADLPVPLAGICVPGLASLDAEFVLTAYASELDAEALESATERLIRLAEQDTRQFVRDVRGVLAGRRHIEQAKGVVMAVRRCGAAEAFELLRRTSQQHQVKLHQLSVALLEIAGAEPAEPASSTAAPAQPSAQAREVAQALSRELSL